MHRLFWALECKSYFWYDAAEYAHAHGATVEAELGHVGDGIVSGVVKEDGNYDNPEDYLTNPEEMKKFIAETGVDCLAVAVGTSHGVYVHEPKLDFERLELLNTISDIPMEENDRAIYD